MEYKEYVEKLKGNAGPADFDALYSGINNKLRPELAKGYRVGAVLAMLALVAVISLFSSFGPFTGGDESVMSFVYSGESDARSSVISFISAE